MTEIAHRMKEVLKETSLSQKNCATLLGLTPAHLNDILHGRTRATLRVVEQVIQGFNVSPDWLLTGEGPKYSQRRGVGRPEVVEVVTTIELLKREGTFGRRTNDLVAVPVLANEVVKNLPRTVMDVKAFIPEEYLAVHYTRIKRPKTTFCCRVAGACISDTGANETIAAVDCSVKKPSRLSGRLCVIKADPLPLIRRLRITKSALIFETNGYPDTMKPLRLKIDDNGDSIIGRLEWTFCICK
jgi:transcriptional regulator with XRE-family HTH domain